MRLLLDTHTVLWFSTNDPQLSSPANSAILDSNNEKWVSPISFWEIAIKVSVGKYVLTAPYEVFWHNAIDANGFLILAILPRHGSFLTSMPFHHRDPFDRMLAAQAQSDGLTLVSCDPIFDRYGILRLW